MSLWLFLCREPLWISTYDIGSVTLTYLGGEKWDVVGTDNILLYSGDLLSTSSGIGWV